uniref:Pancreatic trypsin inhibitor n=1 Tax=Rhipicephalus appendiculatus TaxID=34631 RepID=A0A131YHQ4_RHIAP
MNVLWLATIITVSAPCIATREFPEKCKAPPSNIENKICERRASLWYFSNSTNECRELTNACGKTENTFSTKKACKKECGKKANTKKMHRLCWQRPRQEKCKAAFPRWYWSAQKGCKLYTGCYKNGFTKFSQCKEKCGGSKWPSRPGPRQNLKHKRRA